MADDEEGTVTRGGERAARKLAEFKRRGCVVLATADGDLPPEGYQTFSRRALGDAALVRHRRLLSLLAMDDPGEWFPPSVSPDDRRADVCDYSETARSMAKSPPSASAPSPGPDATESPDSVTVLDGLTADVVEQVKQVTGPEPGTELAEPDGGELRTLVNGAAVLDDMYDTAEVVSFVRTLQCLMKYSRGMTFLLLRAANRATRRSLVDDLIDHVDLHFVLEKTGSAYKQTVRVVGIDGPPLETEPIGLREPDD